jgi:hypothetical protein
MPGKPLAKEGKSAMARGKGTRPRRIVRRLLWGSVTILLVLLVVAGVFAYQRFHVRYQHSDVMEVAIEEVTTAEYPEDPAGRSIHYGEYNGRRLKLIQRDDKHFDFVLEPSNQHTAKVVFRNVDVSLMTPSVPSWCKADEGLIRIALTDREWNRQQVWFERDSGHIEVSGGDGFERRRLTKAALAKNCLNAGLWEVILAVEEDGKKGMYYQGWFTFPMGHYARLVEYNTGLDYADYWYGLEHWFDPAGTIMNMDGLRSVYSEREATVRFRPDERLIVAGEQVRKKRTVNVPNQVTWGDVIREGSAEFATFIPPGRYSVRHPWGNEYWRLDHLEKAVVREVTTPADGKRQLHELELVFTSSAGKSQRFIVGGVDLAALPQLAAENYPQGMYMPMGIGVPPFYQSYADLRRMPPDQSPYYSLLLDEDNRWIDHHKAAIDGPVIHRDLKNPNLVHLYLLSYERHTLVAHYEIDLTANSPRLAERPLQSSER